MAKDAPESGRVLAGRYRLESRLGEGGMGTIWRAEHLVLGAPVAVKLIDRDVTKDEEALARFTREAQASAALRSPHVVQILDYGLDDGTPYMVMELLEGETLAERLRRERRLSPEQTVRIITHVARAVSRAHEAGIVHRDLKPENVFLVKNEESEIAKVLDFGVAKVTSATLGPQGERTRTGSLLGTPFYMSPEQAQGNKTVDFRTDLWALGVIAFECLTGKRPFESDGLGDLVLSICIRPMPVPSEAGPVPAEFDAWFAKACAREPEDRYQSARVLAEELKAAVGGEGREMQVTVSDDDDEWGASPRGAADTERASKPPESTRAHAATIAAREVSHTVRQFGTTRASAPPPAGRGRLIVWVGGGALALGLIFGAVMVQMRGSGDSAAPEAEVVPSAFPVASPKGTSRPAVRATGSASAAPIIAPSASASARPSDEEKSKEEAERAEKKDAGAIRDAAYDGLSPAARAAAAIMKEEVDASAPKPKVEAPAKPESNPY